MDGGRWNYLDVWMKEICLGGIAANMGKKIVTIRWQSEIL